MFSFGQPAQNSQQPAPLFPQANAPQPTPSSGGLFNFSSPAGSSSQTQGLGLGSTSFGQQIGLGAGSQSTPAPLGVLSGASSAPAASLATYPFQYIQQCFDPNHSNYRFRAFFYNLAEDLGEAQRRERQATKPAHVSDALWAQVINDNPDSTRMVPVMANGFSDLQTRSQWQDEAISAQTSKLTELHDRTSKLLRDLDVDATSRLKDAQQRHHQLSLRLLKIMRGFEVLRRSGTKLQASETEALTRLKTALGHLNSGALDAAGLRTVNFQLTALQDAGRLDAFRSVRGLDLAGPESVAALQSLLAEQQASLAQTVAAIQADLGDLQVIRAGYKPL